MRQPDRKEIKKQAREKIEGNIWNIWKPLLVSSIILVIVSTIISTLFSKEIDCSFQYQDLASWLGVSESYFEGMKCTETSMLGQLLDFVITYLGAVIGIGITYYILKLVRGEEFQLSDIFKYFKENLWLCVLTAFLVSLFITLWSLLLVIPGIIAALGYSMWKYIIADMKGTDKNIRAMDVIDNSKELMRGHKWNLFVFDLSFILWFFLCIITFGLACIYVVPYINAANALYYEEIKKIQG